jgi:nitroreductase
MDITEAIKTRRSVRKFKSDPVPDELIEEIIDLALWAPSAMNRQERYFIVVKGQVQEEQLRIFSDAFDDMEPILNQVFKDKPKIVDGMRTFMKTYGNAPVYIFAYAGKLPTGGWDLGSISAALQNLLLAAHAKGLGAVWSDGIMGKEAEINAALGVKDKKLICAVPIGYPDEEPRTPPRKEGRVQWIGFDKNP